MNERQNDTKSSNNIKIAFFLNLCFTIAELIGGLYTNSLAILSDAIHDLGDSFSLGLSWYLQKVSQKERSNIFSYGYKRFSLLAALTNSIILLFGSLYIYSEALPRLINPQHSNAQGMFYFAIVGIIINGIAALRLRRGNSLNERIVSWHILEDVLGWIAILIVSVITIIKDIHILDPALSILIATYVLWNVLKNLKNTLMIFLQSVPEHVSIEAVEKELTTTPKIKSIHDTHIWSIDGENTILTSHLVLDHNVSPDEMIVTKLKAKELLKKFSIEHATIEIERENEKCRLEDC